LIHFYKRLKCVSFVSSMASIRPGTPGPSRRGASQRREHGLEVRVQVQVDGAIMRLRSGRAIRPVEAAVESTSRIGEQYEEIILIDDDEEEIEINVSENSEDINVGTEVEGNLEEIEEERSLNGISRNWQGNLPIDETVDLDISEEEIENNVEEINEDINSGAEVQENLPIDETVDLDISEEEIENNVDEINEDINIGAEVQENLELDESVSNETIDLTDSTMAAPAPQLETQPGPPASLEASIEILTPNIASSSASPSSTSMKCPICFEKFAEIVRSGQQIVTTKCGHVYCRNCLRASIRARPQCPTCRRGLSLGDYQPIFLF